MIDVCVDVYRDMQYKHALDDYETNCFSNESKFRIGEPVLVKFPSQILTGIVRNIVFSYGKIKYSVIVDESTIHNLDDSFLEYDNSRVFTTLNIDKYS
jgi:hypothetical protein